MKFLLLIVTLSYIVSLAKSRTSYQKVLSNILDTDVWNSEAIFFLDTSVVSNKSQKISLSYRTACAIESAARIHKNRTVFLLYTTPGYITYEGTKSDEYLIALSHFDNIQVCYVNLTQIAKNTPVEDLVKDGIIPLSKHKHKHHQELLKLIVLFKFGGVYLENDMLILKSFDDLDKNFVPVQNAEILDGIFSFRNDFYKDQLQVLLEYFARNYDVNQLYIKGCLLLTSYVREVCQIEAVKKALNRKCDGLKVYPAEYFYPVPLTVWPLIFDDRRNQKFENMLKYAHAVHLWEELPENRRFRISQAPITNVVKKCCPKVYKKVPFKVGLS